MNTKAGCDAPVGWIEQCNLLNKLLEEGHSITNKIIGAYVVEEPANIKSPEQCLAATFGEILDGAVAKVRELNAQLNRIADKF